MAAPCGVPTSRVRPIPGAEGDLSLQLTQAPAADHVHNAVQLAVSNVPVTNLSTTMLLPAGMTYMKGTARLDGVKVEDPQDAGDGMLIFRLGAHEAGWKGVLEFDSLLPAVQSGSAPATHLKKTFVIEGFPSGKIEMNAHDRDVMQQIADLIQELRQHQHDLRRLHRRRAAGAGLPVRQQHRAFHRPGPVRGQLPAGPHRR